MQLGASQMKEPFMKQSLVTAKSHTRILGKNFSVLLFLAVVSGLLIVRLFDFISRYAVNILYSDQWYFYTPFFHDHNLWQVFSWQHGPHRQGIGLVVTEFIAGLTHWNSRADAFAVGGLMCLALLFAFILKYRLFGSLAVSDVIVPLLFLTLFQYEAFVGVPNLSYGAFPILMIMLYCLALFIQNLYVRYAVLLGLNFLLLYTGFGLFMGWLSVIFFLLDIFQNRQDKKRVLLLIIVLGLALASGVTFLISYQFNPAIPNFSVSAASFLQYPLFMSLMLAAFWGWHAALIGQFAAVAGAILLTLIVVVCLFHGHRLVHHEMYSNRVSLVVTILLGYSLLFCLTTAIGRLPLGLRYAQVPRYLTLLIPAYLALYFHLLTLSNTKLRQLILLAYFAMALVGSLPLGIVDRLAYGFYYDKTEWASCYLRLEDIEKCNKLTGNKVFSVADRDDLSKKLAYLKEHGLNLYSGDR